MRRYFQRQELNMSTGMGGNRKKIKPLTILLFVLTAVISATPDAVNAHEEEYLHHVLYINSYHRGYAWSDDIEQGLRERFERADQNIEMSVEYLDQRRFTDSSWYERQADYILAKYHGYRLDLVVVSDNSAFDFTIRCRQRLFPTVPIVFCGYNDFRPNVLEGHTNITGVNEEIDVKRLVETALSIQPDTKTMVFLFSTKNISGRKNTEKVKSSVIPDYEGRFRIVVWENLLVSQIRSRLSDLTPNSIVFLLGDPREIVDGRFISPFESIRRVAAVVPAPIYGLWDFQMNTGLLGGCIMSGRDQGIAAAEMALDILNGTKADSIPVLMQSPTQSIFDYAAMQRFNIPVDALPENSIVINRPHSLYRDHKVVVWTILAIFVMLVTFIFFLSINILRRKRVEKELQNHRDHLETLVDERTKELSATNKALSVSEERFRCLSDAAFEGIVITEKGRISEVNKASLEMFGYNPTDALNQSAVKFIAPDQRKDVEQKMLSEYDRPYTTRGLRKDGTTFPIEVQGKQFTYKGRSVRVSAIRDLSREKAAEEEIRALRGILPICSFCKKVRDDEGYWQQVDTYIDKHSEADISHSTCPECAKTHYPELYK
jgi:PAS domain S-box-containing protein